MSHQYIKLERHDDWGNIYFSLPGFGLGPDKTANVRYGLIFEDGDVVMVQWPNGVATFELISIRTETRRVYDHGHSYDVHSQVPGLRVPVHGIEHWVALDEVEIWYGDLVTPEQRRVERFL